MSRTIVIGLGNPIMGDDGIGHWLADNLKKYFPEWTFEKIVAGGWELLDRCVEYDRVVILDAMQTAEPVGTVKRFSALEHLPILHPSASHGFDLFTNIQLGKRLYPRFPDEIIVYGIEVENPADFSEQFSQAVSERLNSIVEVLKKELESFT